MGGLRKRLEHVERAAQGQMIEIPQKDGTVARFPQSAARDAFLNAMDQMGAGDEAPPEHPLIEAARNSSEPKWSESIYAAGEDWTEPVEDLSE